MDQAPLYAVAALMLLAVAAVLFRREHSRRVRAAEKVAADTGTATDVPTVSPYFAALGLISVGFYIYFANSVDERPKATKITLRQPSCEFRLFAPTELRSSTSVIISASSDTSEPLDPGKTKCIDALRSTALAIDGKTVPADIPLVTDVDENDKKITSSRTWFQPSISVGHHRVDLLFKSNQTSYSAAAVLANNGPDIVDQPASVDGCEPRWDLKKRPSDNGQSVAVDFVIHCPLTKSLNIVPALYVNGTEVKVLSVTTKSEDRTYRWIAKRTSKDDRLDVTFADLVDDSRVDLQVRQVATLASVKEGLGALSGIIVGLSGLLVFITQFLRGQKAS